MAWAQDLEGYIILKFWMFIEPKYHPLVTLSHSSFAHGDVQGYDC